MHAMINAFYEVFLYAKIHFLDSNKRWTTVKITGGRRTNPWPGCECAATDKGGTASLRHKIEAIARSTPLDDSVRVVEAKTGESGVSLAVTTL